MLDVFYQSLLDRGIEFELALPCSMRIIGTNIILEVIESDRIGYYEGFRSKSAVGIGFCVFRIYLHEINRSPQLCADLVIQNIQKKRYPEIIDITPQLSLF